MSLNTILATTPLTSTGYHLKATGTTIGNSLIWDNGTNVGIGNTNTSYTLDVSGTGRFTGAITGGSSITATGNIRSSNAGATIYSELQNDGIYVTGANLYLVAPATRDMVLYAGDTERMRITSGGAIQIKDGTLTGGGGFEFTSEAFFGARFQSGAYKFMAANNSTEYMRITSGGNVLINTTTDSGQALVVQAAKVNTYLLTTTNNDVLRVQNNVSGYNSAVALLQTTGTGAGTSCYYIYGELAGGSNTFRVYNNGNVQNTNNSYGQISDISLKKDIVPATAKLDDLMKVNIVNFKFINDDTNTKQIGVIAQELEEIFPSMIDIDNKGLKAVKYSIFVPILIKAIQEQQIQIQNLQEQINILAK